MTDTTNAPAKRTVDVRDIPLVLLGPRRLFARVEDVAAWGWPLAVLLTLVTLIGYATVQTGLIDREIDRRVHERIVEIDKTQRDVVERSELRELYEHQVKQGQFEKLLTRIQAVAAQPANALVAALLTAAIFYGLVAMSGRKPEWHTLLTICVYAGFIDALRLLVELGLMLHFGTLAVYTSLAPLTQYFVEVGETEPGVVFSIYAALSLVDPFRIWYWLAVITGLKATSQLRGWKAWTVCAVCWVIGVAIRTGALAAPAMQSANPGG